jgi:hypothetical protein
MRTEVTGELPGQLRAMNSAARFTSSTCAVLRIALPGLKPLIVVNAGIRSRKPLVIDDRRRGGGSPKRRQPLRFAAGGAARCGGLCGGGGEGGSASSSASSGT